MNKLPHYHGNWNSSVVARSLALSLKILASLRLTVCCLALAVVLVFWGTLAQVHLGLYQAQNQFFRSLFIWSRPLYANVRIPVFPGGYLIGGVLLMNLLAAHATRFKLKWSKSGILLAHAGLILLLLGLLLTDLLSTEGAMRLNVGETRNYSEDFRAVELAITAAARNDSPLVSIPESLVAEQAEISNPGLPVKLRVRGYWSNCRLLERPPAGAQSSGAVPGPFAQDLVLPEITRGEFAGVAVKPLAPVMATDVRNEPAAVVEVISRKGSLGAWLVSTAYDARQSFDLDGVVYELVLRYQRHYQPFSVTLLNATHTKYPGTEIARDFRSRVRIQRQDTGEVRESEIYMNAPLRYAGFTFFQYQMAADEKARAAGQRSSSTLQVVKNPSWVTPYISCALVAAGLLLQFLLHLVGFIVRRRPV